MNYTRYTHILSIFHIKIDLFNDFAKDIIKLYNLILIKFLMVNESTYHLVTLSMVRQNLFDAQHFKYNDDVIISLKC